MVFGSLELVFSLSDAPQITSVALTCWAILPRPEERQFARAAHSSLGLSTTACQPAKASTPRARSMLSRDQEPAGVRLQPVKHGR